MQTKDASRWWNDVLHIEQAPTPAEEQFAAQQLITAGTRLKDKTMIQIGQARLRFLLGQENGNDLEEFNP